MSKKQRYADGTGVPVEKSQGEIIGLLKKRGASDHFMGSMNGRAFLAFHYNGLPVRLSVTPPDPEVFDTPERIERENMRLWRVMLLWVKAQLEAVDNDVMTPYAAFFSHLQLRDGRTVAQAAQEEGGMKLGPSLQLPGPENSHA